MYYTPRHVSKNYPCSFFDCTLTADTIKRQPVLLKKQSRFAGNLARFFYYRKLTNNKLRGQSLIEKLSIEFKLPCMATWPRYRSRNENFFFACCAKIIFAFQFRSYTPLTYVGSVPDQHVEPDWDVHVMTVVHEKLLEKVEGQPEKSRSHSTSWNASCT